MTACQLHSSKQLIYGRKGISQDFPQKLEKVYLRSTRCTESGTMLTARMLSTRNIGLIDADRQGQGSFPFSERTLRTIVYIARGDSLILSRCFVTEAPLSRSELIQGIMRRFPDLAMENIGLAEVHPSMHTINPVAHPGTLCYVVIPVEEDHLAYIALELHLPPYHHTGSISVPPHLRKLRLIAQTGINIVCGPTGELCMCYLNGWELSNAQDSRVHDGDFIICWRA